MDIAPSERDYTSSDEEEQERSRASRQPLRASSTLSRVGTMGALLSAIDDDDSATDRSRSSSRERETAGERNRRGRTAGRTRTRQRALTIMGRDRPTSLSRAISAVNADDSAAERRDEQQSGAPKSRSSSALLKGLSKLTGGKLGEGKTREKLGIGKGEHRAKLKAAMPGQGKTRKKIRAEIERKASVRAEKKRQARGGIIVGDHGTRSQDSASPLARAASMEAPALPRTASDTAQRARTLSVSRRTRKPSRAASMIGSSAAEYRAQREAKEKERELDREREDREREERRQIDLAERAERRRVDEVARDAAYTKEETERAQRKEKLRRSEELKKRRLEEAERKDAEEALEANARAERAQAALVERKKAVRAAKARDAAERADFDRRSRSSLKMAPDAPAASPTALHADDPWAEAATASSATSLHEDGAEAMEAAEQDAIEANPAMVAQDAIEAIPAVPERKKKKKTKTKTKKKASVARERSPPPPAESSVSELDDDSDVTAFDEARDVTPEMHHAESRLGLMRAARKGSGSAPSTTARIVRSDLKSEGARGAAPSGEPSGVARSGEVQRTTRRTGTVLSLQESVGLSDEAIKWKEKEKMTLRQHLADVTEQDERHGKEIRALNEQRREDLRREQQLELELEAALDEKEALKDEMKTRISQAVAQATEKAYQRSREADAERDEAMRKAMLEKRALKMMSRRLQWHQQTLRRAFERINQAAHAHAYEEKHRRMESILKRRFLKRMLRTRVESAFQQLKDGGKHARTTRDVRRLGDELAQAHNEHARARIEMEEELAQQQRDHGDLLRERDAAARRADDLERVRKEHEDELREREEEKRRLAREHDEERARRRAEDADALEHLRERHKREQEESDERHSDELSEALGRHEEALDEALGRHDETLAALDSEKERAAADRARAIALESEMSELRDERESLEAQARRLERKLANAGQDLEEEQGHHESTRTTAGAERALLAAAHDRRVEEHAEEQRQLVWRMKDRAAEHEDALGEKRRDIEDGFARERALAAELEAARSTIEEHAEEIGDLQEDLAEAEESNATAARRFNEELEVAEAELAALNAEIESRSDTVDELLRAQARDKDELARARALLAEAGSDRDALAADVAALHAAHNEKAEESTQQVAILQRSRDDREAALAEMHATIKRRFILRIANSRLARAYAQLRGNARAKHGEHLSAAAQARHAELEAKCAAARAAHAEAIAAAQAQRSALVAAHADAQRLALAECDAREATLRREHADTSEARAADHEAALAEALREARARHSASAGALAARHAESLAEREAAHHEALAAHRASARAELDVAKATAMAERRREHEQLRADADLDAASAQRAHAAELAALRDEHAAALANAHTELMSGKGDMSARHAESLAFARREAALELEASKAAMAALVKQLADAQMEHNAALLLAKQQHDAETLEALALTAEREALLMVAETEAREDLKQQHEALFARLVELHANRMSELFADDTYYIHVNGYEEGPYDRASLQEWTNAGYITDGDAPGRRTGAPQIVSDIVVMPLKSAPTQPRAVPTSRPVWSGAHIKGADSFHRTPTKLASAHDDRPNSPRARARHAAANTRKAPVDLEKRARRRQSADLAGRERSARRGGRHAFEVKSAPRRARAKSTTSSPKAQVIPPRGQFSEQSAAAVALASIVGDGGELAPRSAPAKRGTSASTGGAPLRAVGVGARVPSAPALKNAHARERLFDDQFNAQLLSPGAGFRSPTSPVPLPPPGIPQPRRPTAATLDSEIAALAGAVDRQRSGSAASASASAMSNRRAVR